MSTIVPGGPDPGRGARKPSYVLVAGVLAVVVALILGGGLFLSRQAQPSQRPPVLTAPAPASTQAVPVQEAASAPAPRVSASSVAAAANPSTIASPSAGVAFQVASTPLEREIEAAYLHYWDVRSQAYLNLDTSHLSEAMGGAELDRALKQIADLKAQHRAIRIQVDHEVALVKVAQDQATVADQYLNKSVYVNTDTGQDLAASDPPNTVKIAFQMTKTAGAWKVVDGSLYG